MRLWLKKHWKKVAAALAAVILFPWWVFRLFKKTTPIPALPPSDEAREAEQAAREQSQEAFELAEEKVRELEKARETELNKKTEQLAEQSEPLRQDPKKTNDWLLRVGKAVRDEQQ